MFFLNLGVDQMIIDDNRFVPWVLQDDTMSIQCLVSPISILWKSMYICIIEIVSHVEP